VRVHVSVHGCVCVDVDNNAHICGCG
jgi:hypothetical protein